MEKSRKAFGMLLILIFLTVYCFGAMLLAVNFLPDNRWVQLIFYPIAGVLWIFPVMKIVDFMQPPEDDDGV